MRPNFLGSRNVECDAQIAVAALHLVDENENEIPLPGASGLDPNSVTADSIGLVAGGPDNTAALQAWIDSVAASKTSATLILPDGVYNFDGALQDPSRKNAQIILPESPLTNSPYSITIKGLHPIAVVPFPDVSMPIPVGPVLKSTLATGGGTQPSFIGGRGPVDGFNECSYVNVCLENVIIQTHANPLISALNLKYYTLVEFRGDVLVVAGSGLGSLDATQPTTASSYGVIMPQFNNGIMQHVDHLNVFNFYKGAMIGELSHIGNIGAWLCNYAIEFPFSYHVTLIERLMDWWCPNGVLVSNIHPFQINQHAIEQGADGHWFSRLKDVDDPASNAIADINWWAVKTAVGAVDSYTVNGGTGIQYRRIGGPFSASDATPSGAVAFDSFNDVDATELSTHTMNLGSGWTQYESPEVNSLAINGNKLSSTLDFSHAFAYWTDGGIADCTIEAPAVFSVADANHTCEIIFRWTDANNFWSLRLFGGGSNNMQLIKTVAGVETTVAQTTVAVSIGTAAVLKAVLAGDSISVFVGTTNLTTTDAFSNTATKHGLRMYQGTGTSSTMDNFTISP